MSKLPLSLQLLPIAPIATWAPPPVRSAAALDSHVSENLAIKSRRNTLRSLQNKVHNRCSALEWSPKLPLSMEKLSSMKQATVAKKDWDHSLRAVPDAHWAPSKHIIILLLLLFLLLMLLHDSLCFLLNIIEGNQTLLVWEHQLILQEKMMFDVRGSWLKFQQDDNSHQGQIRSSEAPPQDSHPACSFSIFIFQLIFIFCLGIF